MKRILSGFLAGMMVAGVALAAGQPCQKAAYRVSVNGRDYTEEAVEIEGRTYLPIRSVAESVGLPVEWSEMAGLAQIGTTSIDSPAPLGLPQIFEENYSDVGRARMTITLKEVLRGDDAIEKMEFYHQAVPPEGKEFIVALFEVELETMELDSPTYRIGLQKRNFTFYDGNGEQTEQATGAVIFKNGMTFAGGVSKLSKFSRYVDFWVDKEDKNPKVKFSHEYRVENSLGNSVWFSLAQPEEVEEDSE